MHATRRRLLQAATAGVAMISLTATALALTSGQKQTICSEIAAYLTAGTLVQPGGDGTPISIASGANVKAFTDALRTHGISGTECFNCTDAGGTVKYRVCVSFNTTSGGDATATGDAGADIVIALGGNSTGSAPGGDAEADATGSTGAAAIADGGGGRSNPTGTGTAGGSATASGTEDCDAQGGNGGGGNTSAANGGDAEATTSGGSSATAAATGGNGGDPNNNPSTGGTSGNATAGSPNGMGGTTSQSSGTATGTPGQHGVGGTQTSTNGTHSTNPQPSRTANV